MKKLIGHVCLVFLLALTLLSGALLSSCGQPPPAGGGTSSSAPSQEEQGEEERLPEITDGGNYEQQH